MKQLIILLLFPALCWGQKKDTSRAATSTADTSVYSIIRGMFGESIDSYRYLDTVKALLLCGDTAKYYTGSDGWYEIDPQCYWIAGYIVIERFASWAKFSWLFEPAEPTFLDRKKKPLEKTILVWMVKELN
jgi:hypothetical protein